MPRPSALPLEAQPPLHCERIFDLPLARHIPLHLGPDDCWPYDGPLQLPTPKIGKWYSGESGRRPFRLQFPTLRTHGRNVQLPYWLIYKLRPPLEPRTLVFRGFHCGSFWPLASVYTEDQLDAFSNGKWTRWLNAEHGRANPSRYGIWCLNPNHAGYEPHWHAKRHLRAITARSGEGVLAPDPELAPPEEDAEPARPFQAALTKAASIPFSLFTMLEPRTPERLRAWFEQYTGHPIEIGSEEWRQLVAVLGPSGADVLEPVWRHALTLPVEG